MKKREEVALEDRWKVEKIFPSLYVWRQHFDALKREGVLDCSKILQYEGRLGESPETLKLALDAMFELDRKMSNLYIYIQLKHDEDVSKNEHKIALTEIQNAFYNMQAALSWFDHELITLSDSIQNEYLESNILLEYNFFLEKIFRLKKHTLSPEKESLITMATKGMQTPFKAFRTMKDADLVFPSVKDKNGIDHELSHGTYKSLMKSKDRNLRESAFKAYHNKFCEFENTMAELLHGAIERNVFISRSHHFKTALEGAVYPKNIDTSVYHTLIRTVRENIKPLHDYYDLRKKVLKLDELQFWDLSVPITPNLDIKKTYKEAEDLILKAVAPLGSNYQSVLKRGFVEEGWVDRFENKNKRSGAYSIGSYDTHPYILMNYDGILRDVFTLAHEAGHSMHTLYAQKNQPYHYSEYPIFLAEVASTFNEDLLFRLLLNQAKNKEEKIYLINQKIEDISNTFFRQTMFAEFELKIHELVEQDRPLTPDTLKSEYLKLCKFYFGNTVIDETIAIEWARISHFYYNFYVFQYATGISAALALAKRVIEGGEREREQYLSFMKSGDSRPPIETLKMAGVDMTNDAPIKAAIQTFEDLVKELSLLIKIK